MASRPERRWTGHSPSSKNICDSVDQLLDAHGVVDTDRARSVVESWRQYLEHRDEITALQVLYSQPGATRISFAELRELAERIKRPPHNWTMDLI
jgi:type I restriction enzyme, R subunit